MKTCSKCGVPKAHEDFGKRGRANGRRAACKECLNAEARERIPANKVCSCCKTLKPRSEFSRRGDRGPFAVMSHCRECSAVKHSKYMESEQAKERDRAAHNEAYAKDPALREKIRLRGAAQYNPEKDRTNKLKCKYGLTPEAFESIVSAQAGVCAICGGPPNHQGKKVFCVDHNHKTGKVRGLLCSNCNIAIGYLKDSPELAFSVGNYLKKHNS